MTINREKGFTLIELLVVIAIIGILSSVVLASLNTARTKGQDAKVKSQLSGLRLAAEIYYDNNQSYGAVVNGVTGCTSGMFSDTASGIVEYSNVSNYPPTVVMHCNSSGLAYAVSASLPGNSSNSWCVDSKGASREILGNLGTGVVECPGAATGGGTGI